MLGKGDFKEKARSNSQAAINISGSIPSKINIQWSGMWKGESKHIAAFMNERTPGNRGYKSALKSSLGSKEIEVEFSAGFNLDIDSRKKIVPDLISRSQHVILYLFYSADSLESFNKVEEFVKTQFEGLPPNLKEQAAKRICLISDNFKGRVPTAVKAERVEKLKDAFGIQFYQCCSADNMSNILAASLEEYVITVAPPAESKAMRAAEIAMKKVGEEIRELDPIIEKGGLNPQELVGLLGRLKAAGKIVKNHKECCLNATYREYIEKTLHQFELKALDFTRKAVVAGGPSVPTDLYHLYVEHCEKVGYWESQATGCLAEIQKSRDGFVEGGKSDFKSSANKSEHPATAAYERLQGLSIELQAIEKNYAASRQKLNVVRRLSQSYDPNQDLSVIGATWIFCNQMLSQFIESIEKTLAEEAVKDIIRSVQKPEEAKLESFVAYNRLKKTCLFFGQIMPQSSSEEALEWKVREVIEARIQLFVASDNILLDQCPVYLAKSAEILQAITGIKADSKDLEGATAEDILKVQGKISNLAKDLEGLKIILGKYKAVFHRKYIEEIEKNYSSACVGIAELESGLKEINKSIKIKETSQKAEMCFQKIEDIEKRFSGLARLEDVRRLQAEAKVIDDEISQIQNKIKIQQGVYGREALKQVTENCVTKREHLKTVSGKLDQMAEVFEQTAALESSLKALRVDPDYGAAVNCANEARKILKELSSISAGLDVWLGVIKESPLYSQMQEKLQVAKGVADQVILVAERKCMDFLRDELRKILETPDVDTIKNQYERMFRAEKVKNHLAKLQVAAVQEAAMPLLEQVERVLRDSVDKVKTLAGKEYRKSRGDMTEVLLCHKTKKEMTNPILHSDGYHYENGVKPRDAKVTRVLDVRAKKEDPDKEDTAIKSLSEYVKTAPKSVNVDGVEIDMESKAVEPKDSKAGLFFENVKASIICSTSTCIMRKPITNNVGKSYDDTLGNRGLKKDSYGREEIKGWYENKTLEDFIVRFFEAYPEKLEWIIEDWVSNKDIGGSMLTVEWLASLRIPFRQTEKHIRMAYEKMYLPDPPQKDQGVELGSELGSELARVKKTVAEASGEDRLDRLLAIQQYELPDWNKLLTEVMANDAASPEIGAEIEQLSKEVSAQIARLTFKLEFKRIQDKLVGLKESKSLREALNTQRHMLHLNKLISEAERTGKTLPDARKQVKDLGTALEECIDCIVLSRAADYCNANLSLIPLEEGVRQRAPSFSRSSLFQEIKEGGKSVVSQHSSVIQSSNGSSSSSQFYAQPVSENKPMVAPYPNDQQVTGNPEVVSVTTMSSSQQPAGGNSHFSSSADQLPAGNSLNS